LVGCERASGLVKSASGLFIECSRKLYCRIGLGSRSRGSDRLAGGRNELLPLLRLGELLGVRVALGRLCGSGSGVQLRLSAIDRLDLSGDLRRAGAGVEKVEVRGFPKRASHERDAGDHEQHSELDGPAAGLVNGVLSFHASVCAAGPRKLNAGNCD
jgi:hypothetical protein